MNAKKLLDKTTPGDWKVMGKDAFADYYIQTDGQGSHVVIATTSPQDCGAAEANAQIIAAAPALARRVLELEQSLEALQKIRSELEIAYGGAGQMDPLTLRIYWLAHIGAGIPMDRPSPAIETATAHELRGALAALVKAELAAGGMAIKDPVSDALRKATEVLNKS